jgi:4-hydroxybenzoate polyprenyltransferase
MSRLDIDDPIRCLQLFRSNRNFGLIIFAAAVLDSLFRINA